MNLAYFMRRRPFVAFVGIAYLSGRIRPLCGRHGCRHGAGAIAFWQLTADGWRVTTDARATPKSTSQEASKPTAPLDF
jgi:hypothetical protein